MHNSPGGYSWLGMAPEPRNIPLTEKEKERLDHDLDEMKNTVISLEKKITLYHTLCKKYEKEAGTTKGEKLFHQLEVLKKEIERLSKKLSSNLDDSSEITHLED